MAAPVWEQDGRSGLGPRFSRRTASLSLSFSRRAEAVAAWRDAEAEATAAVGMVTAVAADTVIVIVPTN